MPELARVRDKPRLALHRCLHHGETLSGCRHRLRPMHGGSQGNEVDLLQRQTLEHIQGRAQVAEVDRIEGAAKDANHTVHIRVSIRAVTDEGKCSRCPRSFLDSGKFIGSYGFQTG